MKNIMEMQTTQDFYECEELYIDEQQLRSKISHHQKDIVFHRQSFINLKQIIDFCDSPLRVDVIDEDKFQ